MATVTDLEQRGVGFRSLTESIDTTTPGGKLIFHIFGALAEFERDLIRERTLAGLTAVRARGRHGGRKPVAAFRDPNKLATGRQLYHERQLSIDAICQLFKISRTTFYRCLAADRDAAAPLPPRGEGRRQHEPMGS